MNKDVNIIFQNSEYIYIEWEKDNLATNYFLMGLNKSFNYEVIKSVKKNKLKIKKDSVKDYISLVIYYVVREKDCSKDVIIGKTNEFTIENQIYKIIELHSVRSYKGITLSANISDIYDKYYLYEKIDDEYKLAMILEDFAVTSEELKEGHTYYMEAYAKEEEKLVLKAKSMEYVLNPERIIKNSALPKISVVIPVYNSEDFIARCIDSVLLSTFKELEIVLIDDESKDKSGEILDWYQKTYPGTVRVHHQKNQGVSFARNKGIELAKGEYIGLVDNDDMVHPKMYEELYTCAKLNNNSPICIGKTVIREGVEDYNICLDVPNDNHDRFKSYTYFHMLDEKLHCSCNNIYFVAVWNKIIKADLMKAHPLPPYNHYEDTAYTKMIYSYIDNFTFAFNAYYIWDKRRRKTTGTASTYNYKNETDDWTYFHRVYRESNFYAIDKGNPDKMAYIIYETMRETYEDLKKNSALDKEHDLYKLYKERIVDTQSKYDIFSIDLVQKDKAVKEFLEGVLS